LGLIGRKEVWVNVLPYKELVKLLEIKNPYFLKNTFHDLLIIEKAGELFAMDTKCPHQGKSLEGCWEENDHIICPVHQYSFSLENGRGHGMYLERYDTRIQEGWFKIKKEKWSFFGFLI
jgi:3-phenylpropionate/trans-cinnamate dioxygenase ferredoxin subunit